MALTLVEEMSTTLEQQDLERVAVACMYLLLDKAALNFPGTSRAHPSELVVISLKPGGLLRDSDRAYFPLSVWWYVWEQGVVPVLKDEANQVKTSTGSLRNKLNLSLVDGKEWDVIVQRIVDALQAHMQTEGLLPSPATEAVATTDSPSGEPIVTPTLVPSVESSLPTPDQDDLLWPEGHPKLVYPEVT